MGISFSPDAKAGRGASMVKTPSCKQHFYYQLLRMEILVIKKKNKW